MSKKINHFKGNGPVAFAELCKSPLHLGPQYFHHSKVKPPACLAVSPHSAPPPRVATTGLCSLSAGHLFWGISRPVFLSLGLVFLRFFQASFLPTLVKQVLSTDRRSYCTLLWMPLATHLSTNDLFSFLKDKIPFVNEIFLFPIGESL